MNDLSLSIRPGPLEPKPVTPATGGMTHLVREDPTRAMCGKRLGATLPADHTVLNVCAACWLMHEMTKEPW